MIAEPPERGRPTLCGGSKSATTSDDVRAWLTAFFLELPSAPVYAAARGEARFLDPDKSPSAFDWPAFTAEVLGPRSQERLWVLTWARCQARRRAIARNLPNPPAGGSVSDFCRETAVPLATFYRVVDRSIAVLAREWDCRRAGSKRPRPEGPDPPDTIAAEPPQKGVSKGSSSDPKARKPSNSSPPVSTTQS